MIRCGKITVTRVVTLVGELLRSELVEPITYGKRPVIKIVTIYSSRSSPTGCYTRMLHQDVV